MRPIAILTAAALVAATLAAPVLAQQGQPQTRRTQAPPSGGQSAEQPHLITIDFEGGTLEQLVDALKAASDERPVNIIYSTEAANIPIPPFEVRDADLYSTLQSLSVASSGSPTALEDGRMVSWEIGRVGDGVYSVYLSAQPQFGQQGRMPSPPRQTHTAVHTAVHSITELTTGTGAMSADDVLSAVQAALAIEGADDETKIRYHEATGLVFARVTPAQGNVIEQTLMSLRLSMQARERGEARSQLQQVLDVTNSESATELAKKANSVDNLRRQVLELQRINAEQQTRIIELQDELARFRKSASQRHQDGGN